MVCIICKKTGGRICGNEDCLIRVEEIDQGSVIRNKILQDLECSRFLMDLAVDAILSARWKDVFVPMPVSYKNLEHAELVRIATKVQHMWDEIVLTCTTGADRDLHGLLGSAFIFLKFTMMSHLGQLSIVDLPAEMHPIRIFQVSNSEKKEKEFSSRSRGYKQFLYHGSSCENWYSIIRNGLKNMSGSKWQVNGRKFGNGIYAADIPAYSLGYTGGKNRIIAVLEPSQNPIIWKKGAYYVIPDPADLIIRYLIVISYEDDQKEVDFKFSETKLIQKVVQKLSAPKRK